MLSHYAGAKVWTASYQSFALWDVRMKELLKVFYIDGRIENLSLDSLVEDEMTMNFVSESIEKNSNLFNSFQLSRNVRLGAVDVVRQAAVKGDFVHNNKHTEALVAKDDGLIWTRCANGLLMQWDGNGNRLQDFQQRAFAVQSLGPIGTRKWVGYVSGSMQVLDFSGSISYLKPRDNKFHAEFAGKEFLYSSLENVKVLAGMWNITPEREMWEQADWTVDLMINGISPLLFEWLEQRRSLCIYGSDNMEWIRKLNEKIKKMRASGIHSEAVYVGFKNPGENVRSIIHNIDQECLSSSMTFNDIDFFLFYLDILKRLVGQQDQTSRYDEIAAQVEEWQEIIRKILDESTFSSVGPRQLVDLLFSVWTRNNIQGHIGDVDTAAVPGGLYRVIGNKGSVGLWKRVDGRMRRFVNCHVAVHLEAVNRRKADFDCMCQSMNFGHPASSVNATIEGVSSMVQVLCTTNAMSVHLVEAVPELSEADMVVFLGNFNYRLDVGCELIFYFVAIAITLALNFGDGRIIPKGANIFLVIVICILVPAYGR